MIATLLLSDLIQTFFRRHLILTRGVSPHTLHAYRDAIRGLLTFAAARCGCSVVNLTIDDLGRDTILAFLEDLETRRGNMAVTRNARLAAIHSLFRFIAAEDPAAVALCGHVLAIPYKRTPARPVMCLARADIEHLLNSIDRSTVLGRRDLAGLQFLYNTGARAQEVVDLRLPAVRFEAPTQVRLLGKGRKERLCPLWSETVDLLRAMLRDRRRQRHRRCAIIRECTGTPIDALWSAAHRPYAGCRSCSLKTRPFENCHYSAHLSPHHRVAPAPSRRRAERGPQLAGTR